MDRQERTGLAAALGTVAVGLAITGLDAVSIVTVLTAISGLVAIGSHRDQR